MFSSLEEKREGGKMQEKNHQWQKRKSGTMVSQKPNKSVGRKRKRVIMSYIVENSRKIRTEDDHQTGHQGSHWWPWQEWFQWRQCVWEQGPANDGLEAKPSVPPVSVNNDSLDHTNPVHLGIVCGHLLHVTAGMGSCQRPDGIWNLKYLLPGP